jgi:hypothetical protein
MDATASVRPTPMPATPRMLEDAATAAAEAAPVALPTLPASPPSGSGGDGVDGASDAGANVVVPLAVVVDVAFVHVAGGTDTVELVTATVVVGTGHAVYH